MPATSKGEGPCVSKIVSSSGHLAKATPGQRGPRRLAEDICPGECSWCIVPIFQVRKMGVYRRPCNRLLGLKLLHGNFNAELRKEYAQQMLTLLANYPGKSIQYEAAERPSRRAIRPS